MNSQRKSERTRARILTAAGALFAERGYERTTVRDVAEAAGVDPALVIRYFKNKDGLFARATEIRLALTPPAVVDPDAVGEQILTHFLAIWEGDADQQGMAVLLRSAASNAFAAAKMREAFLSQVVPFIAALGDPAESARRAGLVSTQLLGLAMCRYVLALPPVVSLTRAELFAHVAPVLQRYALGHGDDDVA